MAKKKNKQVIRPWCWYCEREFEDEKVLMQHQKAKHFKCNMCPRRLNTAGGLAVHIQQVHKLEPENLPRIENALPGRDGYEIEIFGMEGIPAPDIADYKRRKEIELGLAAGSISQPQTKRPKVENRPLSEEELKAQLEAHKALMGATDASSAPPTTDSGTAVYGAPPQAYAAPPAPAPGLSPAGLRPPMGFPGAPPPFTPPVPPPGAFPGPPPFPPMAGMPFPGPPPGLAISPGFPPPGVPPFMPGMPPPPNLIGKFPTGAPPTFSPPSAPGTAGIPPIPGSLSPTPNNAGTAPSQASENSKPSAPSPPPKLTLPDFSLNQTNPSLKKKVVLKYMDANFSPDEQRSRHLRYYYRIASTETAVEESRGKKRARAEDFL